MSKSLEFCKTAAADQTRSTYSDRDWGKAIEFNDTETFFDNYLHGNRKFIIEKIANQKIKISFNVKLLFDNNANFDYFTSYSCVHDGTLLFIEKSMSECVRKVLNVQTYYLPLGNLHDGDSLKYTIGNFVILNEYDGDFVPSDKPWLRQRTTVVLPIKMEKI